MVLRSCSRSQNVEFRATNDAGLDTSGSGKKRVYVGSNQLVFPDITCLKSCKILGWQSPRLGGGLGKNRPEYLWKMDHGHILVF